MNFNKHLLLLILTALFSFNFCICFAQEVNCPLKQYKKDSNAQMQLENGYYNYPKREIKNSDSKSLIKSSILGVNSGYSFSKKGHKLGHTFLKTGVESAIDRLK